MPVFACFGAFTACFDGILYPWEYYVNLVGPGESTHHRNNKKGPDSASPKNPGKTKMPDSA